MDTTDKEITAISLFSGYGGLDLGVRKIIPNLRVVAYVEIEAYADALLASKISKHKMDEAPIFTDVTQFPSEEFRDKVHLVIAGYPCQDFSFAGNRAGLEGNRGKMWGYTRSIINGVNARAFFGENVDGHLSLGFDTVVSDLAEDGYMVKGGLYSAFEVGAPHLRKRIFSLSFKSDPREEPWASRNRGNQGWIDINEAKFQALTTGKVELSEPKSGYSTIEGCIRQTMGNPIDNGHTATEEPRETRGSEKEGWLQESEGRCSEGRDTTKPLADDESERRGSRDNESRSDSRGIQDEEREIRRSIRSEAGGSSGGDGELADTDSDGFHGDGDGEQLGEEKGKEGPAGNQPTQAIENSRTIEEEHCLWLAKLYDEGFPGTEQCDGEFRIKFETEHPHLPIRWPSRPGRAQQGWEEPRTILLGDPKDTGCEQPNDEHKEKGQGEGEHTLRSGSETSEGKKTEPIMGREPNAVTRGLHTNRIERLRMLGNGVLWLTASKAFSELLDQHEEHFEELDKLGKL